MQLLKNTTGQALGQRREKTLALRQTQTIRAPLVASNISTAGEERGNLATCRAASPVTVQETRELERDPAEPPSTSGGDRSHETDYVVIGSGIGGASRCR